MSNMMHYFHLGDFDSSCVSELGNYSGNKTNESCEDWSTVVETYANANIPQILDVLRLSNFPDITWSDAGKKCRLDKIVIFINRVKRNIDIAL